MLPNEGGMFQQNEDDIKRLLAIYQHLDQFRKDEDAKALKE